MKGIYDWLEYVTQTLRFSFGQYWDLRREIRSAIQTVLTMRSARDVDWQKLIHDAEWVGKETEEESDRARADESRDRNRDGDCRLGHK